jgi:hypothetical protein
MRRGRKKPLNNPVFINPVFKASAPKGNPIGRRPYLAPFRI